MLRPRAQLDRAVLLVAAGRHRAALLVAVALATLPAPARPASNCGGTVNNVFWESLSGSSPATGICFSAGFLCKAPEPGVLSYRVPPGSGCNPNVSLCEIQAYVTWKFPGNVQDGSSINPSLCWYNTATAPAADRLDPSCGNAIAICGSLGNEILSDFANTFVSVGMYRCSTLDQMQGTYSQNGWNCKSNGSCFKRVPLNDLILSPGKAKADVGCVIPPPDDCSTASNKCEDCRPTGGCSIDPDGRISCKFQQSGAHLHYLAGGAGGDTLPGTAAWRAALGLYWSHDYAQRIVIDNPTEGVNHVWLITEGGSFREFKSPAPGSGLYDVTLTAPSDEYRRLYYDSATPEWRLDYLDGRQDHFRSDGLWLKTTYASDTFSKNASYSGSQLTQVDFPDGRKEVFTYYTSGPATGKLHKLTEVGVGVTDCTLQPESCREWTYAWSADELTMVTRPDGTAWEMTYDPSRNGGRTGYLTQVRLVAGAVGRVESAFEYNSSGRAYRTWRGDPSFSGTNAIDKEEFAYDNSTLPTQTIVTEWINDTTTQTTTYTLARDSRSIKPKITNLVGACPACGLAPTTIFTYGDSANPLRETRQTNGRGYHTDSTYDGFGRLVTKTEAVGTTQQRLTTYEYETSFPALLKAIQVPSTSSGFRRTEMAHNATSGLLESRALKGTEAGGPAALSSPSGLLTGFTNNTSGQVLIIDPPPVGGSDITTFTYNIAARNGHLPDQRIDPIVGATHFDYDALNRRKSVIDPNGVETTTTYDTRGRVTESRQKGAVAADDLVTTYFYDCPGGWSGVEPPADDPPACRTFGDLRCVQLPRGNGIEYRYDAMGRLTAVGRKTNCDPATQPLERTLYTLDRAGNRTLERRQRWSGSAWTTDSATEMVYTSRCHADKMVQGKGSATESTTEYCYDKNNNLEKVWDALHTPSASFPTANTLNSYDALDRLTSVARPWPAGGSAVTSYEYDAQDHLSKVIDAESNQTTYTTGDRDLMTSETSAVTGTTTRVYDEHAEMTSQTDGRGVVMTRAVDAFDRVTLLDYSGTALDTSYTYDDPSVPFSKGRLTRINRGGGTVDFTYDRFGRTLQDGALLYGYDKNGYRTTVTYPGGVEANYTPDFADRDAGLTYDTGGSPTTLVSGVSYRAGGPLDSLTLGNSLVETRTVDARYYPDRIQAGTLLDWDYTVDALGNPLSISGTITGGGPFPASVPFSASFQYLDHAYFLTQGNGPWGNRNWTYDRIGNRLTFAKAGDSPASYCYAGGACAAAHNPKLQTVTPAPGWGTGAWSFTYDSAGNQTQLLESNDEGPVQTTFFDVADDGRMSALRTDSSNTRTDMLYDGRGFLRQAEATVSPPGDFIKVTPTYSSSGMLFARTEERRWSGGTGGDGEDDPTFVQNTTDTTQLFYFAGRPVAQLTNQNELLYLTTDHLGTPVLLTDASGTAVWAGALEPFGAVWTATVDAPDTGGFSHGKPRQATTRPGLKRQQPSGVLGTPGPPATSKLAPEKLFLRYPGQWVLDAFRVTGTQQDIFYNVHRWYEPQTGRYSQPDPIGLSGGPNAYIYADADPSTMVDPFGLAKSVPGNADYFVCCKNGERTICEGPHANDRNVDPAKIDCEREHEEQHLQDFNSGRFRCSPQCTKDTPDGTEVTAKEDRFLAECAGYCHELECLNKKGKTPKLLERIRYVEERIKHYCGPTTGGTCPKN